MTDERKAKLEAMVPAWWDITLAEIKPPEQVWARDKTEAIAKATVRWPRLTVLDASLPKKPRAKPVYDVTQNQSTYQKETL